MQLTPRYSQIKNNEWDGILGRDDLVSIKFALEYVIGHFYYEPSDYKKIDVAKKIIAEINEALE